nr:hypothetical protein [Gluconacetobacter tumulisoli]
MLAGCVNKPAPQAGGPANPFGYIKRSAVCQVGPVHSVSPGQMAATMTVRSDDGNCGIVVQQTGGQAYASFGVSPAPEHGKAFIYNFANHTYVTYTPNTAYAGQDRFTVTLIRGGGQPREYLAVTATVDATGVVVPVPAVSAPAVPAKPAATPVRRRAATTRHH